MNDLQVSGIAGLITGGITLAGGYLIEDLDTDSLVKHEFNKATGHGLKLTGSITAAAGLTMLGVGTLLAGLGDSGEGVFDAPGMP